MSTTAAAATRADFRYFEPLRVRWAEVDMQKIVFNGHYLMYFDSAVAGYWRALALPYAPTMENYGGDLYVRKATVDYLGSAHYDDVLDVGMRCGRIGTSSMLFQAALFRGSALLVTGELVYVFADPSTQTSRPVPEPLRRVLQDYEAGAEMIEVRIERGAGGAVQATALNRLGAAVGSGGWTTGDGAAARLLPLQIVPALRRSGHGRVLLQAIVDGASDAGIAALTVDPAADDAGFYRACGFDGSPSTRVLTASSSHRK